jgi:hypothetical protein
MYDHPVKNFKNFKNLKNPKNPKKPKITKGKCQPNPQTCTATKEEDSETKQNLVRLQKKAKLRKMREEKEKVKQQELKKKNNLDALNDIFKKRTENYKRYKAMNKDKEKESLGVKEVVLQDEGRTESVNRLKGQGFKDTGGKNKGRRFNISGEPGRKMCNLKQTKKVVKKVINIPFVRMSKNTSKSKNEFNRSLDSGFSGSEEDFKKSKKALSTVKKKTQQGNSLILNSVLKTQKPKEDQSLRKTVVSKLPNPKKSISNSSQTQKSKKFKKSKKSSAKKSQRTNRSININFFIRTHKRYFQKFYLSPLGYQFCLEVVIF